MADGDNEAWQRAILAQVLGCGPFEVAFEFKFPSKGFLVAVPTLPVDFWDQEWKWHRKETA